MAHVQSEVIHLHQASFNTQAVCVKGNRICHCMNLGRKEEVGGRQPGLSKGYLTLMRVRLMPIVVQRALKPPPPQFVTISSGVSGSVMYDNALFVSGDDAKSQK